MISTPRCIQQIDIPIAGGPDVLCLREVPCPQPGPSQVLIRVAAAGVNRLDCFQRAGFYPPPAGASSVPGLEVAGEIVAVGAEVSRWHLGDRVCALLRDGGYADYAVAESALCLPVPAGYALDEAAALPEALFTVWSMLWQRCALQPGESVLIQGGSSGVGSIAIQLARALGHPVFATAGSADKLAVCRQLGATLAIDYRQASFAEQILTFTQGYGVDVILDMVGQPYLARHLECLAEDGRLALIAYLGGARGELDLRLLLKKRLTVTASTLRSRSLAFKAAIAAELEARVWPLLQSGAIRPWIDRRLPLSAAAEAHRRLEAGSVCGKLLLCP